MAKPEPKPEPKLPNVAEKIGDIDNIIDNVSPQQRAMVDELISQSKRFEWDLYMDTPALRHQFFFYHHMQRLAHRVHVEHAAGLYGWTDADVVHWKNLAKATKTMCETVDVVSFLLELETSDYAISVEAATEIHQILDTLDVDKDGKPLVGEDGLPISRDGPYVAPGYDKNLEKSKESTTNSVIDGFKFPNPLKSEDTGVGGIFALGERAPQVTAYGVGAYVGRSVATKLFERMARQFYGRPDVGAGLLLGASLALWMPGLPMFAPAFSQASHLTCAIAAVYFAINVSLTGVKEIRDPNPAVPRPLIRRQLMEAADVAFSIAAVGVGYDVTYSLMSYWALSRIVDAANSEAGFFTNMFNQYVFGTIHPLQDGALPVPLLDDAGSVLWNWNETMGDVFQYPFPLQRFFNVAGDAWRGKPFQSILTDLPTLQFSPDDDKRWRAMTGAVFQQLVWAQQASYGMLRPNGTLSVLAGAPVDRVIEAHVCSAELIHGMITMFQNQSSADQVFVATCAILGQTAAAMAYYQCTPTQALANLPSMTRNGVQPNATAQFSYQQVVDLFKAVHSPITINATGGSVTDSGNARIGDYDPRVHIDQDTFAQQPDRAVPQRPPAQRRTREGGEDDSAAGAILPPVYTPLNPQYTAPAPAKTAYMQQLLTNPVVGPLAASSTADSNIAPAVQAGLSANLAMGSMGLGGAALGLLGYVYYGATAGVLSGLAGGLGMIKFASSAVESGPGQSVFYRANAIELPPMTRGKAYRSGIKGACDAVWRILRNEFSAHERGQYVLRHAQLQAWASKNPMIELKAILEDTHDKIGLAQRKDVRSAYAIARGSLAEASLTWSRDELLSFYRDHMYNPNALGAYTSPAQNYKLTNLEHLLCIVFNFEARIEAQRRKANDYYLAVRDLGLEVSLPLETQIEMLRAQITGKIEIQTLEERQAKEKEDSEERKRLMLSLRQSGEDLRLSITDYSKYISDRSNDELFGQNDGLIQAQATAKAVIERIQNQLLDYVPASPSASLLNFYIAQVQQANENLARAKLAASVAYSKSMIELAEERSKVTQGEYESIMQLDAKRKEQFEKARDEALAQARKEILEADTKRQEAIDREEASNVRERAALQELVQEKIEKGQALQSISQLQDKIDDLETKLKRDGAELAGLTTLFEGQKQKLELMKQISRWTKDESNKQIVRINQTISALKNEHTKLTRSSRSKGNSAGETNTPSSQIIQQTITVLQEQLKHLEQVPNADKVVDDMPLVEEAHYTTTYDVLFEVAIKEGAEQKEALEGLAKGLTSGYDVQVNDAGGTADNTSFSLVISCKTMYVAQEIKENVIQAESGLKDDQDEYSMFGISSISNIHIAAQKKRKAVGEPTTNATLVSPVKASTKVNNKSIVDAVISTYFNKFTIRG